LHATIFNGIANARCAYIFELAPAARSPARAVFFELNAIARSALFGFEASAVQEVSECLEVLSVSVAVF
jgi:hypothetical protein